MNSRAGSPPSRTDSGTGIVKLSREHRTAIIVAIIMAGLLLFVNFFRNGTSW
jgi:hypothetical protein